MTQTAAPHPVRTLIVPGLATLVALAILIGLGTWQLQRRAWKEGLIAQIQSRAYGEAGAIVPEAEWGRWQSKDDEFRKVKVTGTLLNEAETPVYGLAPAAPGGSSAQGYYLMTPLRLPDGAIVMINRGFVPMELKDPATRPQSQPKGETTVTGLVRAPEERNMFTPADSPEKKAWFARDPQSIAKAHALDRVAPFYVEADATPNPGGWPKGGQIRLELPNNHLQYAVTWFGIALTLVGVFAAFAWRRFHPLPAESAASAR
ncbi:SURF1 family protein [Microvirga rosea]|uniref:SURF1 family protein n=1 Tax=Microvirga rosea TaxID=2715425 RepID=UPI001D0A8CFE|nr:SURF1 family protein [Microvirga rosea]MCB8820348.1 SURF1 family protein [Microvirga rosea]